MMAHLYSPTADPSRVYYGTDTRLQALLVGAALGAVLSGRAAVRLARGWAVAVQGLGAVAAVALVAAIGLVQDNDARLFRGGFLAVAVLSALVLAALVTTDGADRGALGTVLAWRPLVVIGLMSYGIYLWHWPVFVTLTPLRTGLTGPSLLVLRVFVTLVLAAASYVFVEQPIRRPRAARVTAADVATPTGLNTDRDTADVTRLGPALLGATAAVLVAVLLASQLGPAPAAAAAPVAAAPTSIGSGTTNAFLLGDSVAYNLRSEFPGDVVPGLRVTGSTQLGCGLLPDQLTAEGKIITPGADCFAWHQRIQQEVPGADPDVGVLFVGSWEQYDRIVDGKILRLGTPEFEAHLDAELSVLLSQLDPAKRPVGVMNDPCHRTPDFGLGPEPRVVNDENRVRQLNAVVTRFVAANGPRVHLLDFHAFLCSSGYTVTKDGVTLRTDGLHYTPEGARLIWTWLGPQLLALASS